MHCSALQLRVILPVENTRVIRIFPSIKSAGRSGDGSRPDRFDG